MVQGDKKLSKNDKKRLKKKIRKQEEKKQDEKKHAGAPPEVSVADKNAIKVEYVSEKVSEELLELAPELREVLNKFKPVEQLIKETEEAKAEVRRQLKEEEASGDEDNMDHGEDLEVEESKDEEADEGKVEDNEDPLAVGRRKKKQLKRFTVAELKQIVERPDLVESHDAASPSPLLLLHLKGLPNTVPVPRHWLNIRKYLQGKRGKERVSYKLPDYIGETGINKIRAALAEQEANAKARRRARERINPSLGKMEIDYQVLHDAFFKYQKKPKMKGHGELYFEGAEGEASSDSFKPGRLSKALMEALGMDEGSPPPWILQMQRHGPPPSYPRLKIPGVNAPIPKGASWGLHEGGWGNAPVDQFGRGLYGDVFGVDRSAAEANEEEKIDKTLWAKMVSDEEESSEEEEEEAEDEVESDVEDDEQRKGSKLDNEEKGASRNESNNSNDFDDEEDQKPLELRKQLEEQEDIGEDKKLYQVLKEEKVQVGSGAFSGNVRYRTEDIQRDNNLEDSRQRKKQKIAQHPSQQQSHPSDSEPQFKF